MGLFFGVLAVYYMVRNRFVLASLAAIGADARLFAAQEISLPPRQWEAGDPRRG